MKHVPSELQMQRRSCVRLAQRFVPCSSPGPFFPVMLRAVRRPWGRANGGTGIAAVPGIGTPGLP